MWRITVLVVFQCALCLAIRVPVYWTDDSEVNRQQNVEINNENISQKPIYNEYFQYTAHKPQFAIEIAASHGVPSPEKPFKSHPIKPYTGLPKPQLGQHRILNSEKNIYKPYQQFVQNTGASYVKPVLMSYDIFHPYKSSNPYKAEQSALQAIYKDPILAKIRNDVRDNNKRLQSHENEALKNNIRKEEYLESPEQIDRNKHPEVNVETQFEVHRPQRRPVYYRIPPRSHHTELMLNQKLRHPWNQNMKVTPAHYQPVKNHLSNLRQQHALQYNDAQNEYPQVISEENAIRKPDGYDIYDKGKEQYIQIRNNFEDSITKVAPEKNPYTAHSQEIKESNLEKEDDEEFVPIKNYAQVRKTETTKHLPRKAALDDAETLEEIQNAPRLREAIKSTKAQIVYSEEGYEDAAYDHAGEQKHASDHEKHGGYLKENESSKGKFKIPSVLSSYKDLNGSIYGDKVLHGKKWKEYNKNTIKESESNENSESEGEHYLDADIITDAILNDVKNLNNEKLPEEDKNDSNLKSFRSSTLEKTKPSKKNIDLKNALHDVIKRETSNDIPKLDINSTILLKNHLSKLLEIKQKPKEINTDEAIQKIKYPYYFRKYKKIDKNSPLRYAENFALIPKKSKSGSEFYDSRSTFECPEVEEDVDPIPEKLKCEGHPDDYEPNDQVKEAEFKRFKDKQRLKGLGDKIDCYKIKYFGKNPLDSPFFEEKVIENPEPITKPNLEIFESKQLAKGVHTNHSEYNNDIFSVLKKFHKNQKMLQESAQINKTGLSNESLKNKQKIKNMNILNRDSNNTAYNDLKTKYGVTIPISIYRNKRAAPFMYEPYKIIRDSQIQDSKKTTTTGNISPLIKQLQSSRIIDKVVINSDKEQTVKRNAKMYKDIGKNDRQKIPNAQNNDSNTPSFIDTNLDQRRGEPRFELRPANHKNTYSPVENSRALSIKDSTQSQNTSTAEKNPKSLKSFVRPRSNSPKMITSTIRPFFDVSKYLPQVLETQSVAATTAVRKIVRATTLEPRSEKNYKQISNDDVEKHNDNNDDEDEIDDEEDDKYEEGATTRTTTISSMSVTTPSSRKRNKGTTTTVRSIEVGHESETPKLRLTTRFRNSRPTGNTQAHQEVYREPNEEFKNGRENNSPKYTEKKKKTTKSTLVTDTKTYGEDDDDTTKKEVDALIGVKHDMDEYTPRYEKDINNRNENYHKKKHDISSDDDDNDENEDEEENDDDDDDDDDNDDDFGEDDDSDEDEDEDDEDDSENENSANENDRKDKNLQNDRIEITTSEPTKRTLAITTLAPATTTESQSAKLELKPTILKKKIEIHEELPANIASPHVSKFKQDIKEIEVIKEVTTKPRHKINKNIEALELFKDENLAEEVNKLGDVEVFKENMDLKSGPKHGGNYRAITAEELKKEAIASRPLDLSKEDAETSQSKTTKLIQLDKFTARPEFGTGNGDFSHSEGRKSAKIVELRDVEIIPRSMHGGNLKFSRNKGSRQSNSNERYFELDENHGDDNSNRNEDSSKSYGNRNTGRPMHGGNYRSARIVQSDDTREKTTRGRGRTRGAKTNSADILNGFARAAPILTTPAPFILDPSKRMYYYVDA